MLWLLSCSLRLPSARVDSLELTGLGWEQAEAVLVVAVDNPLRVEVPITALDWSVELDGRPLARGALRESVALSPDAETRIPLPMALRYAELPTGGEAVRATVSLVVETPLRPVTLTFDRDWTLPALPAPTLELLALDPGWTGSEGRLALAVQLGLPDWVWTGRLGWALSADDRPLGAGQAALGRDHRLTVELGVDPSAVAWAGWDAWRGRVSTVHLSVDGQLDTAHGALPVSLARELVWAPP